MKNLCFAIGLSLCVGAAHSADFFAARTVGARPADGECIGNAADPLCVFDTVIACAVRKNPALCESVGLQYDSFFRNSMAELAGRDYKYAPVEMYVNRRKPACAHDNDKACALNPATQKIVNVDMSVKDNNNVAVYLRREQGGKWSVIFAAQYACWSDEECS
jgi:hypothetical protein